MSYNPIVFPGLGLEFDPNPVAFSIAGKDFYWYGIIIAVGFLLAAIYTLGRSKNFGVAKDDFIDLLIFAVPISIIGTRIYYVVFNFSMFKDDLWKIFRLWEGGLAIYGAVIGAFITAFVFSRVKKIKLGALLDLGAFGFLIGQCVGRWGNFINREAHGVHTELPWRMELYDYEAMARIAVHPTFLYESLWNLIGFLLLHILSKKRSFDGQMFMLYIAWYGLGRALIEGLRTDSLYLFSTGIRVSQLLSIVLLVLAVLLLIYNLRIKRHSPETLYVNIAGNSYERDLEKKRASAENKETRSAETDENAPEDVPEEAIEKDKETAESEDE